MIKIVFLGTAGAFDSRIGNTSSILIVTKTMNIILDAGSGFYKLDQFTNCEIPTYLFISHFHLDHVFGLHTLSKFKFKAGLNFLIADKHKPIFNSLLRSPYTVGPKSLKFPTVIYELPSEREKIPFNIQVLPLLHSVYTLGIRLTLSQKIISYCTDTGICDNLFTLSKNADLLISECSHLEGEQNNEWPHLNPEEAAHVAVKAKVKKLILTHFDSLRYSKKFQKNRAEKIAQNIFGNTIAAKDNLIFELDR